VLLGEPLEVSASLGYALPNASWFAGAAFTALCLTVLVISSREAATWPVALRTPAIVSCRIVTIFRRLGTTGRLIITGSPTPMMAAASVRISASH
jgi:hypothetical protein